MGNYNIGPRIGIDGEKEFRQQIKNINDAYKTLEAETRAVTAAFEANGDEQSKLGVTAKQLQKEIDLQKSKMELLQDAVNKATAKYGENSAEATRLKGALYDTQATVAGLEVELKDTRERLSEVGNATDALADDVDDAGDKVADFGDILKGNLASDLIVKGLEKAADIVKEFASGTIDAAAEVKAANSQFSQSFGDLETEAKAALTGISDDTKIATTRMQESYTRIFAFAKTVGAESGEALDIASRAMVAAADSAAYYDKSIEGVTETLQSFLKGNYENDAALGISATEVSRNTMANQLYAKSFQELSESQKVDTLLAMVEAGNAASGAIGQAARESDSWENVTGELSEAFRQLQAQAGKPALQKLTPVIQKITDATYELIEDVDWDEFGDTVEDVADIFIDNGPAILKTITSLAAGFVAFKATKKAQELVTVASSFVQMATAANTAGTAVAASGAVAAASPWGLAATAIAGVVALVTSLAIDAETTVSDLERSTERLKNSMENANETYAENSAEINGAATAAEYYISRLYELEAAGLDNAAASREYEMTVEALNELIPDLNLAIDEQTGLVNANKDALLADVEAWKQNATAKALQEKYTDVLEAQARAEADLIDAQARSNKLTAEAKPLEDKLKAVSEKRIEAYKEQQRLREEYEKNGLRYTDEQTRSTLDQIYALERELIQLNEEYSDLQGAVSPYRIEQEKLQKEIDEATAVMNSYDDEIQNARNAMELFNKETEEGADDQSELSAKVKDVQEELDALSTAYSDAQKAARESIDSQIGLFDELETESDWSAQKIISNWNAQKDAFTKYQTNLQKAKKLGLDDAIVTQLSDGSEESMQILAALVNDTKIRVADINKAFEGLDQSKENVSRTIADIQVDFTDTLEDIEADARRHGITIGKNLVAGITDGVNAIDDGLTDAVDKVIDSLKSGRTPTFDFEKNLSGFSTASSVDLSDMLTRAENYPSLYAGTTSTQTTTNSKTLNVGGVTVQIYAQPGQDVYELAQAVQDVIQTEINREEAGL